MVSATIVFDLDGTLVETAPDLVAALNAVLGAERLPPVPYEHARNLVGGGARMMIERGLAAEGRTLPAPEVDRLLHDFIDHYSAHIADHSRPFDGVEAALDGLSAGGFRLAVCTNKLEWLSLRLLGALGMKERFAAICGADTFGVGKPDPTLLLGTIARAGGRPDLAVMVGDSITDIATARAAAIPIVAVDFGYTDVPVAQLGPDRIVSHFSEIPATILCLLNAGPAETQP
jgi:phosphoglycolate phosphatase